MSHLAVKIFYSRRKRDEKSGHWTTGREDPSSPYYHCLCPLSLPTPRLLRSRKHHATWTAMEETESCVCSPRPSTGRSSYFLHLACSPACSSRPLLIFFCPTSSSSFSAALLVPSASSVLLLVLLTSFLLRHCLSHSYHYCCSLLHTTISPCCCWRDSVNFISFSLHTTPPGPLIPPPLACGALHSARRLVPLCPLTGCQSVCAAR